MLVLFSAFVRWLRLFRVRTLNEEVGTLATGHPPGDASDANLSVFDLDQERVWSHFDDRTPRTNDGLHRHSINQDGGLELTESSHAPDLRPARARKQGPVLTSLLKSAKNISIGLIFAATLAAQQGSITLYQVTTAVSSASFNNINPRYNAWTLMYNYSGSGTFSIELDCAPDATTAGGTPTAGVFVTCSNTVTGTNPSTTPNYGYITFVGYTPWLKIKLGSISSGNMTALAVGFTAADPEAVSSSGCAGTAATPCIVAGPNATGVAPTKNPVQTAGYDGAGNVVPIVLCTTSAVVNISSMGETQIIALSSGKTIRVCNVDLSFPTPAAFNLQVDYGTGTNCATGTGHLTGIYTFNSAVLGFFDDPGALAPLVPPASNAVCLNLSAAVTVQGTVSYAIPF